MAAYDVIAGMLIPEASPAIQYITHAEVILMKIVVVRSPKALAPILRLVFKIKKEA